MGWLRACVPPVAPYPHATTPHTHPRTTPPHTHTHSEEDGDLPLKDAASSLLFTPSQPSVPDELGVRAWEEGVRVEGCVLGHVSTVGVWVRLLESIPQGSLTLVGGSSTKEEEEGGARTATAMLLLEERGALLTVNAGGVGGSKATSCPAPEGKAYRAAR